MNAKGCNMMRSRRAFFTLLLGFVSVLPLACSDPVGPELLRVRTIQVAPALVPCAVGSAANCLEIRESDTDPWEILLDPIEGFAYEPGFLWVIRVNVFRIENPPMGGSDELYRFKDLVSKTPAP
jgi:hypothetical protein